MECFIVEQKDVNEEAQELCLTSDEAHHVRVLRVQRGDKLLATNLLGTCYECELIELIEERKTVSVARCRILGVLPDLGEAPTDVLLIAGLLAQPARWELLLEKATELGARIIRPVATHRTEKREFKPDRAERIVRAAAKQSRRANKPWIPELSSLREALAYARDNGWAIIVLHEAEPTEHSLSAAVAKLSGNREKPSSGHPRIALVIGPEGGLTDEEIENARNEFHAEIASLGNRRLRAETAAIAAVAIVTAG
jgi:16S rRNA (uracil1498-N3)-methyltransferase